MTGDYPYWGAGAVVDRIDSYLFDEELVLLGEDGAPFFDDTRDVAFRVQERVWVNNHIHVLRPQPAVDARFLTYCLNVVDYGRYIEGSTRDKLTQDDMREIELPAAGIERQRRVADFLDDQVARIDNIIAARSQQAALQVERWSGEVDRLVDYRHHHRSRLAHFARVQTGVTVDAGRIDDGGVEMPYLRVANVQAGALNLENVKSIRVGRMTGARALLRHGDVLMTEGGDLDKLGRGTLWRSEIPGAIHQNHVFAVRCNEKLLRPEYLAHITASSEVRRYFESTGNRTTNLASTSSTKVLDLPIPVISLGQQDKIIRDIDQALGQRNEATALLGRSRQLLQELKRSLITAAVTGEFDVSTADGSGVPV